MKEMIQTLRTIGFALAILFLVTQLSCSANQNIENNLGSLGGIKTISDVYDLQSMRDNLDGDYVLTRNIIIPYHYIFQSIGTLSKPFTGTLNGAGFSITGLELLQSTENYIGLFGVIETENPETVVVKNLILRNVNLSANAYVGALVGWLKKGIVDSVQVVSDRFENSTITVVGSEQSEYRNYGYGGSLIGLAGTNVLEAISFEVQIINSSSTATVKAAAIISSPTNNDGRRGTPNGLGGIVGVLHKNAIVINSHFMGEVKSYHDLVGGIAGENRGHIRSSYVTGTVLGFGSVGGITGINSGTVIAYLTETGKVQGLSGYNVGGLVGLNIEEGEVTGYSNGEILSSGNFVGGLVGTQNDGTVIGYSRSLLKIINSNYDIVDDMNKINFGRLIGNGISETVYYSEKNDESTINILSTNSEVNSDWIDDLSKRGSGVDISTVTTNNYSEVFNGFEFGSTGQWTFSSDGEWPILKVETIR